jgi:putative ABC transport system ATP-binding protein
MDGGALPVDSLIVVSGVSKSYHSGSIETRVLREVTFQVERGSFTAIVGPSGCGKSTLLALLGGLDSPDSGNIVIDGVDLARLDRARLQQHRRRRVGFVFQFYNLLPTLNAAENVEAGIQFLGLDGSRRRKRALEYLDHVGLGDRFDRFPGQLSGGEQQRVAVARALAREPALLLMDEPTGNLDQATAAQVVDCIERLQARLGVTCVLVTHDLELAAHASRRISLRDGRVVPASLPVGAGDAPPRRLSRLVVS